MAVTCTWEINGTACKRDVADGYFTNVVYRVKGMDGTEEKARFKESSKSYVTKGGNKMVLLSPSTIVMGAKRSEKGQRANETIRKVDLTKPFYMSIYAPGGNTG